MLRKKRLEGYVLRRCERIRNCLYGFCLGCDPEALHQLRVEVKKLKALAGLLQACTGRIGRAVRLDVVRPLYHHAACIRSAQVNLQMLKEYGLHEERFEQEQRAVLAA